MPRNALEVTIEGRVDYDVKGAYSFKKGDKSYKILSVSLSGVLNFGNGISLPVSHVSPTRWLNDGADAVSDVMLTLRRGDKVRVSCALEERTYMAGERERWALQLGPVYNVKVVERVGADVEVI